MNQTKKRLAIIELAISITDIETINLQLLKLQPLKSDENIHEILSLLEEENYAQAQGLISHYIETPIETVIQRIPEEEQAIIDEFDFLEVKTDVSPLPIEDSAAVSEEKERLSIEEKHIEETSLERDSEQTIANKTTEEKKSTLDTLLHIHAEDVMPENIVLKTEEVYSKEKIDFDLTTVPKDQFFNHLPTKSHNETMKDTIKIEEHREDEPSTESENSNDTVRDTSSSTLSHIHQKLQDLQQLYPLVSPADSYSEELENWIEAISENNYTQSEIEEMLQYTETLAYTDKKEAALFLLATSLTESQHALFVLARALYKGTLLTRNLEEAFKLMSQLTFKDRYPEAMCDLAQFYENGIAVDKNRAEAKKLYKEAMDLGIARAKKHYERINKTTKGLLSFFNH